MTFNDSNSVIKNKITWKFSDDFEPPAPKMIQDSYLKKRAWIPGRENEWQSTFEAVIYFGPDGIYQKVKAFDAIVVFLGSWICAVFCRQGEQ